MPSGLNGFLAMPSVAFVLDAGSAAASPGGEIWKADLGPDVADPSRNKPRTFPYHSILPYATEDEERRMQDLHNIEKKFYIAVQARDFAPGALHWTRELRSWLELKFDMPKSSRVALV